MKVVGKKKAVEFGHQYPDAKSKIDSWVLEAEDATWLSPSDIKERYSHVSFLAGNRAIFNIRGNNYRLVTVIDYQTQTVLFRWIGTHADYSRQRF